MQKYINTVTDFAGNKISGALVNVTDYLGGAVTLYSDFSGTTPIGSTLTTDAHGQFAFFAEAGRYTINVSGPGIESYTISDIQLSHISYEANIKDFGAIGNGIAVDQDAFTDASTALSEGAINTLIVSKGSYLLTSDVILAGTLGVNIIIDPGATFTGGILRMDNYIPWQITPLKADVLISKTKDTTSTHDFQNASYIKGVGGTGAAVAVFGEGDAAGSQVWGGNFVGVASTNVAGSAALAVEINPVNVAGTTASTYGVVIASAGDYPSKNAIQIQANNDSCAFDDGIKFNYYNHQAVSKNIISVLGTGTAETFLNSSGVSYTVGELSLPSFAVQATVANAVNKISVKAGATGVAPTIEPLGSDTNITLSIKTKGTGVTAFTQNGAEQFRVRSDYTGTDSNLYVVSGTGGAVLGVMGSATNSDVVTQGKGSGGLRVVDGAGAIKIQTNTTGIGFNATTPVAKPTVTGSRGGNAALASLISALAAYGLITDSTTA